MSVTIPVLSNATGLDLRGRRAGFRTVSGGAFSPSDISGQRLWLAADAIVGLVDADPVASWGDSSLANNDASQATAASRPVYKTAIRNGKPVVRFDGTDDYMDLPASTLPVGDTSYTYFSVHTHGTFTRALLSQGPSGTTDFINVFRTDGASEFRNYWWADDLVTSGAGMVDNGWYVVTCRYDTAVGREIWVDGTIRGNDVSTTRNGQASPAYLGCTANGAGRQLFFWGDIAEIIVYDSALSVGNRTAVEDYLGTKYAL